MASDSASTTRRVHGAGLLRPWARADGTGTIWTAVSTAAQGTRATLLDRLVPGCGLNYPGAAGRDFSCDWSRYRQIWQLQQDTAAANFHCCCPSNAGGK